MTITVTSFWVSWGLHPFSNPLLKMLSPKNLRTRHRFCKNNFLATIKWKSTHNITLILWIQITQPLKSNTGWKKVNIFLKNMPRCHWDYLHYSKFIVLFSIKEEMYPLAVWTAKSKRSCSSTYSIIMPFAFFICHW